MSRFLYQTVSMFSQYLFSIRAASGLTDINETLHSTEKTLEDLSCNLDFSPVFSITSSCISFFLPSVVMIGIYVKLWSIGRGHVKSIKVTSLIFSLVKKRLQKHKCLFICLSIIPSIFKTPLPLKIAHQPSRLLFCYDSLFSVG